MANAGDLVDQLTRRKGMFSARDVLFPELGAVPVGRLAEGILRAPRRGWRSPPILSACAPERSTPSALPAGLTTSARLLAETGWESPELLARAAAARQAMVAARVGGAWWVAGAEPEMPESRLAVVALAEPDLADPAADRRADPETAAAMLGTALSAYSPKQVVVLAPSRTARRLYPSLAAARARGAIVIERACDPWSLLDRADRVYSIGGEIGFLGAAGRSAGERLRRRGLHGLGCHRRRRPAAARLPPLGGRDFRRHLPRRDALPRSVPRCRDRLRGRPGNSRRVAPDRDHEPPHRGVRRHVVLEAAAHRRFSALVGRRAGVPPHDRGGAGGGPRGVAARRSGAIAGWASRLPAGLAEAAAVPA